VANVFRKRNKAGPTPAGSGESGEEVFQGLRRQVLELDPASAGLGQSAERSRLWGALMEMGFPNGVATLAALADGTTSLYTSTGGGIIGGGFHQAVAAANQAFLACVEEHITELQPDPDTAVPASGVIIIRALTYTGRLSAEAPEDDLGHGRHPLSPVFHAGHQVLSQLRMIDEARRDNATGR
jgi:hypothetical protein